MTKEAALLKLKNLHNQSDPEQARLNLVEYFSRIPNGTPTDLDAAAAEYEQELLETIARPA